MTPALETQEAAAPARTTAQNSKRDCTGNTTAVSGKEELPLYPGGRYFPTAPRNNSTLGSSLFFDPIVGQSSLGDLRARIELKAAACAALGRFNGYPPDVRRIKNLKFRALVSAGMLIQDWNVRDLIACTDGLEGPADSALIATLENPIWGPEDFHLLGIIESLENLQSRALGGARTL